MLLIRRIGSQATRLAGWLAGQQACLLAGWLAGGWLAGWPTGWLTGWPARGLAGWFPEFGPCVKCLWGQAIVPEPHQKGRANKAVPGKKFDGAWPGFPRGQRGLFTGEHPGVREIVGWAQREKALARKYPGTRCGAKKGATKKRTTPSGGFLGRIKPPQKRCLKTHRAHREKTPLIFFRAQKCENPPPGKKHTRAIRGVFSRRGRLSI